MTHADYAALVAGGAALLSSLVALWTALRQGKVNRRLIKLQLINVERREFRDGLLLLGATSRVVAERSAELTVSAKSNGTAAEVRPKFEAFSAAAEYLLQAWSTFSSKINNSDFTEIRESISRILEATEAARLGWIVLTTGGPASTAHAMAGYADTAAQWSGECQRMCAVGAQSAVTV